MRNVARVSWLYWGCLAVTLGCAQNPQLTQGQLQSLQQQQFAVTQQNQELQTRATTLDRDNQELAALLAQARQQSRVYEDQSAALREQLTGTTAQLTQLRDEYQQTTRKTETLVATAKRKASATIPVNNSLARQVPSINIPGVESRVDGDVVRIELPGNQLFAPGGAQLLPQAMPLIQKVADEIASAYPQHIVGVEGHTDSDPIQSGRWANNHQLSVGRAMAVYDQLSNRRTRLSPEQLFVVGHGPNHPVVSNATPSGKERNRRVELVIYPERVGEK
jgi:flagellar motor protein MotB